MTSRIMCSRPLALINRPFDTPLSWRYSAKDISQAESRNHRMEELTPLTPDEFKKLLSDKGWSPDMLAIRWGLSKRRIQQITADADRPRYYDDAIGNLPIIVRK